MEILKYIQQNAGWLKDTATLIFAATGTIIAILTYRRAKATIFQPIRTEVIKKQSELLSDFLSLLKDHNHSFENGLDYINLVQLNVLLTLNSFGFVFNEHREMMKNLQSNLSGWLPCGTSNVLKDVVVIGALGDENTEALEVDAGRMKFDALKSGQVSVEKIYLTKHHVEFMAKLSAFSSDPFMPAAIQNTLDELNNDINSNLTIILKKELEVFMLNFSRQYFPNSRAPKFDPVGVYNDFNHSRIHHKQTLIQLRSDIRKYLRIDERW